MPGIDPSSRPAAGVSVVLIAAVSCAPADGFREQAILAVYGGSEHARHGREVLVIDDADGDGYPDIAASSENWDNRYYDADEDRPVPTVPGRVVLRSGRTGRVLSELEGSHPGDSFGSSLADMGDVDGDGRTDLAIGAVGYLGPSFVRGCSGARGEVLFELEGRGWPVTAGHDLDGDGIGDVALIGPDGDVRAVSGREGCVLQRVPWVSCTRASVILGRAGDVDGDGMDDLVLGDDCELAVRSGADLSARLVELAKPLPGDDRPFSSAETCGVGDVDGDEVGDVLVETGADLWVFSGASGRVLHASPRGELILCASGGGDVDGDGVPDFAFSRSSSDESTDGLFVHSGATGAVLFRHSEPRRLFAESRPRVRSIDLTRDLDGDGRADLVVGVPDAMRDHPHEGAVYVFSGRDLVGGR